MTVQIITGDCRDVLKTLPDQSVHMCCTSPPYFGLRDYGVEGQIGLEQTPDAFVAELVAVFDEVRRVLRDDGTLWLNLGDSYNAYNGGAGPSSALSRGAQTTQRPQLASGYGLKFKGLKPKDLIGIPWRVAFALQAAGWYLRQDIIWHKPNPMPESVRDRCTKAHEYMFMLSKSQRYYYDQDAIVEPMSISSVERLTQPNIDNQEGSARVPGKTNGNMKAVGKIDKQRGHGRRHAGFNDRWDAMEAGVRPQRIRAIQIAREKGLTDEHIAAIRAAGVSDVGKAQVTQSGFGKNTDRVMQLAAEAKAALGGYYREFLTADSGFRNKRSVWTVATQPFKEAHFATFPPDLIEPCIKAGCPEGGTVLDPFGGSGTTGLVADRLRRHAILIELNPAYAEMARNRISADAGMFAEVGT